VTVSLMLSRMRTVALRRRKQVVRDDESGYETACTLLPATVQPLTGAVAAQMYGERLSMTKLLLAAPDAAMEVGMGVCVDVAPSQPPDYRVVYVAGWSQHAVAHIRYIPEAERAAASIST
jgi:hypothetical protein